MSDGQSAPHPLWAALYFTLCWSTVDFSTCDSLSLLTIDVYMQPLTVTKCTCCKCANISQLNTCTPDSTKTVIHNQRYCDLRSLVRKYIFDHNFKLIFWFQREWSTRRWQVLTLGFLNEILINGRYRADNSLLKLEVLFRILSLITKLLFISLAGS